VRRGPAVAITALALLAAPRADAQQRTVVRAEPGTPVVAAQVLVAVGPAEEPEGQAGITYLTARAVTAPILGRLDSLAAHLSVEQHRDAVSFTVIAAPDSWEEATRTLLVALFRDPVDSLAVTRQRTALVAELRARESSPSDAIAREVDAAVHGSSHPWGRSPVGTVRTMGRLGVRQVDAFLREGFTPDRAVLAVVGPVRSEAVRALELLLEPGPLRAVRVEVGDPARRSVRRQYDAITAWVAASYAFGPDDDAEALRMLASLALDHVAFGLLRPQVYDARATLVRHADGGELRLQLVVPPAEVEAWGRRVADAVEVYGREPMEARHFDDRLRRYRGERLLELDAPEARAGLLARRALLGEGEGPLVDIESLTAERIRAAALSLAPPVLVFLGPFVEDDGAPPPDAGS
jgi:predicted Zn-dependent peptidase